MIQVFKRRKRSLLLALLNVSCDHVTATARNPWAAVAKLLLHVHPALANIAKLLT